MAISVGVDEAGRGCVIGPLVVAAVAAEEKDRRWFWKHNVRDSKLVRPEERERLAQLIMQRCWFTITIAVPTEIDAAVRDRTRTLNGLELDMMSSCLKSAVKSFDGRDRYAVIDAPSINARGFGERLRNASGWHDAESFTAMHRADERNRTVGAASIIAKTERERLIALLKNELGCDFGSGYCHDPRTIEHLRIVAKDAPHVRWSWVTAQRRVT